MNDENVNTDTEESARKVKNSKGATTVVQEIKKIIRSKKFNTLWLIS